MTISFKKSKVISNQQISNNIYQLICDDDSTVKAGQFYMLKLNGNTFLPRPISIAEKNSNLITFLYAVVGEGTKEYSKLEEGDKIFLTGPLGNGFPIEKCKEKKVALVSGGIGIAPLLQVAKELFNVKAKVDLFAGFRDETFFTDRFQPFINETFITTESGKTGHKGFITEIFTPEKYDLILCCGPEVMMKRVVEMSLAKNVKIYVSMEKHMACGVGACLACTCKTTEGVKRTCADGPVFDGSIIKF